MSKQEFRNSIRRQRLALSSSEQTASAEQLYRRISQIPQFKHSDIIAGYWPVQGEISPLPLLKAAIVGGKQVYLPVLQPTQRLAFAEWLPDVPLIENQYGIPEPFSTKRLAPEQLELVLLPLLAFTAFGYRLGSGKGYYDRTFAYKKTAPQAAPTLWGLGYAFQQIQEDLSDPWDIPLQGVITENHFFKFD